MTIAARWVVAVAWLLLVAGVAVPRAVQAQTLPVGGGDAGYDVALVTVAPGEVYWERFGHNGLLLRDRADGRAVLYHYGIFDFEEKNFLWNFIRGYMTYSMASVDPRADLAQYRADGRGVTLQWLALDDAAISRLHEFLRWNARPENAKYRYDYFLSNCSTKVRDAIDRVLGGALARGTQSRSRGVTFRMQALRLTSPDVPLALGISAGLGPYADRPVSLWEETFVPAELARRVGELRITGADGVSRPLVSRTEVLSPAVLPLSPSEPPRWWLAFAIVGAVLAVILFLLGRARGGIARRAFGVLAGATWLAATIGGALLLFLWFATEHVSAWRNANVLLFNPLAVLLLPAAWRALRGRTPGTRFARGVALAIVIGAGFALALRLTVATTQDIYDWVLAWLPVHVALLFALREAPRDAA